MGAYYTLKYLKDILVCLGGPTKFCLKKSMFGLTVVVTGTRTKLELWVTSLSDPLRLQHYECSNFGI